MTQLTPMPRRDGKPAADRYFRNDDTGHCWRVRCSWQAPQPANVVQVDAAARPSAPPTEITVNVSVAWCAEDRSVRLDDDGEPMIFEQRGRTFGERDFTSPTFDPDETIGELVRERVAAAERVLIGRGMLIDAMGRWNADQGAGVDRTRKPTEKVALERVTGATPGVAPPPAPLDDRSEVEALLLVQARAEAERGVAGRRTRTEEAG